jgi:hypothetical protein
VNLEFDLPDYMSTWYKLTLLHIWCVLNLRTFIGLYFRLCLMRLQLAFDAAAYQRIQYSVLSSLWYDIDARLKVIGVIFNNFVQNLKNLCLE